MVLVAGACSAPPRGSSRPDAARRGLGGCDATLPADFPTIAEAVDALGDGATICLDAGTFTGTTHILGISITLRGAGVGATILDGEESLAPLTVYTGGALVAEDLSIVNGDGDVGGCVYVREASLTLRHVEVRGCVARDRTEPSGGGVGVAGGTAELVDVDLVDNSVTEGSYRGTGGGLSLRFGSVAKLVDVRVLSNKVSGHWAEAGKDGGGIFIGEESRVVARRLTVLDNSVSDGSGVRGGGVAVDSSSLVLLNSVIADNILSGGSEASGAGLWVAGGYLGLRNATVHNNRLNTGTTGGGAGVAAFYASLRVHNSALTENKIVDAGADPESLGLALLAYRGTVDLRYSDFYTEGYTVPVAGRDSPVGSLGNVSVAPDYMDVSGGDSLVWDLRLASSSALIDAGDPALLEQDGSAADIGAYGGPGAAGW